MKKKIITLALAVVMCLSVITSVTAASNLNRVASTIPGTDIEYNYVENVTVQIPGTEVVFELEGVADFVFVEQQYTTSVSKPDSEGNYYTEEYSYDVPVYTFTLAEECGKLILNNQDGEITWMEGGMDIGWAYDVPIDSGYSFSMPTLSDDESENRYIRNKFAFKVIFWINSEGELVPDTSITNPIARVELDFINPNYYGFDESFDADWYYKEYLEQTNTVDISEFAVFEKSSYSIIEGANSVVNANALTIKTDGDFDKFTGVKVDGELVDSSNYTATEGSTIIEFKADYLKTLEAGEHTVSVVFTDGEATTKFEITEDKKTNNTDKNENNKPVTDVVIPNTDYNTSVAAAFVAMATSGTALIGLKKKSK